MQRLSLKWSWAVLSTIFIVFPYVEVGTEHLLWGYCSSRKRMTTRGLYYCEINGSGRTTNGHCNIRSCRNVILSGNCWRCSNGCGTNIGFNDIASWSCFTCMDCWPSWNGFGWQNCRSMFLERQSMENLRWKQEEYKIFTGEKHLFQVKNQIKDIVNGFRYLSTGDIYSRLLHHYNTPTFDEITKFKSILGIPFVHGQLSKGQLSNTPHIVV